MSDGGHRLAPSWLLAALGTLLLADCGRDARPGRTDSADGALAAPAAADCPAIAHGEITGTGVGPLRLGGRVAATRAACALRDTAIVLAEGMRERAHAVSGAPVIIVSTGTDDTSAVRILVRGAGPRTARGVGVGSAIAELRAVYDSVCVQAGEGRSVLTTPRLRGVSFALDRPRPRTVTAGVTLPSSNLAPWDSARVSEIWVHGKPVVGCHAA